MGALSVAMMLFERLPKGNGFAKNLFPEIFSPLTTEIGCRTVPARVFEDETERGQSGWHNPAALENEFGFRTHQHRTDLEHPPACGQAEGDATRVPEQPHEFRIR